MFIELFPFTVDDKRLQCHAVFYSGNSVPPIFVCSDITGEHYIVVKIGEQNCYGCMWYHYLISKQDKQNIHELLVGNKSLQKLFQSAEYFWSAKENSCSAIKYPTESYFRFIENKLPPFYINYANIYSTSVDYLKKIEDSGGFSA